MPPWPTSSAPRRAASETGTANIPAQVRALIESAQSYYQQGLAALRNEDLTAYSADMKIVGSLVAEAETDLSKDQKPVALNAHQGTSVRPPRGTDGRVLKGSLVSV